MSRYVLAYDNPSVIYQKLYTDRTDDVKSEALKAKVKDPLWFLTRQWQYGEFLAESCGYPVRMELSYSELPIQTVRHKDNDTVTFDPVKPMEWYIEDEVNGRKPEDWDEKSLEYSCDIEAAGVKLHADEYYSGDLDWFDFTAEGIPNFSGCPVKEVDMVPVNAVYRGMPAIRYWAFEDGSVNFKSIVRQDENVLTTMLTVFSQLFGEDWYMVPLEQKVGTLRKIRSLKVYDNFSNMYDIPPIADQTPDNSLWSMFTLTPENGTMPDGSVFFLPNTIASLLESEDMEEVSFVRDEMMNMVWAVENKYEIDGRAVDRNDELAGTEQEEVRKSSGDKPLYTEMGQVPENWIPYFPVKLAANTAQMALKRGRTAEVPGVPYNPTVVKGWIVNESGTVNEEEIPATPVSIVRKYNMVNAGRNEKWEPFKDSSGKWSARRSSAGSPNLLLWSSREKKVGKKIPLPDLKFDQVD